VLGVSGRCALMRSLAHHSEGAPLGPLALPSRILAAGMYVLHWREKIRRHGVNDVAGRVLQLPTGSNFSVCTFCHSCVASSPESSSGSLLEQYWSVPAP